jgi:hypothetical protein
MKFPPLLLGLLLLFLLLLPSTVRAADVDGFKGMRWGSSLSDLQQTKKLMLTKEGGKKGASLYVLENEELRYGKANLTGITCSFAKDRLEGVILLFSGAKNFAAVKTEAFAKFGESTKIDQAGEEMYNWPGKTTSAVLSYNPKKQSGFLFMKVKKMPPPFKTVEKRKPTAAADLETALDKAPPVKIPTPRPSASPADMETALDRATPLPHQPSATEAFTPEMQSLIFRDQVLTQQCWETAGVTADAACTQMRENIERLKAMGLCMEPAAQGRQGSGVVWRRCGGTTAPPGTPPPMSPSSLQSRQPSMSPQDVPPRSSAERPLEPSSQQQPYPPSVPQLEPQPGTLPVPSSESSSGADKSRRCRLIGEFFAAAAQMRDNGVESPVAEEELVWRVSSQTPEITIERIRETVELIYFDQEYRQASGELLIQRVSGLCQSGRGPYAHPLP